MTGTDTCTHGDDDESGTVSAARGKDLYTTTPLHPQNPPQAQPLGEKLMTPLCSSTFHKPSPWRKRPSLPRFRSPAPLRGSALVHACNINTESWCHAYTPTFLSQNVPGFLLTNYELIMSYTLFVMCSVVIMIFIVYGTL